MILHRLQKRICKEESMKIQWKPLMISIAISLGTGFLSFILAPEIRKNYGRLFRPPLSPPGWVFPVVWTVLFLLMGIAAYLIYETKEKGTEKALELYVVQLFVNLLWPVLFFQWKAYLPAFLWLLLLWFLVWKLLKVFGERNLIAGILLLPYLAWLTFAAYLNLAIALHYLK